MPSRMESRIWVFALLGIAFIFLVIILAWERKNAFCHTKDVTEGKFSERNIVK